MKIITPSKFVDSNSGQVLSVLNQSSVIKKTIIPFSCKVLFTMLCLSYSFIGVAQTVPNFGAAGRFTLFTVTGAVGNTGVSNITGDVGTNTGAITGFEAPSVINGTIHLPGAATTQAATDLVLAYNEISAFTATNTTHAPAFGGGETITPGVYALGAAGSIAGTMILDAQGNPNALFIFKIGGAFTTGAGTTVKLINGALANHIFWIADGAIAMAAVTTMHGIMIANGAISMADGGILHGKMYSTTGAVSIYSVMADDGVGGMVSANQTICSGTQPADLTLAGNAGNIVKWQKSADDIFTSPVDIASTANTLTGAVIGNLSATTCFRAVVQLTTTATAYSGFATVAVNYGQTINFGTAANFALFTTTGAVNNAGTSTVTGDIGSNVGAISGFQSPTVVNGTTYSTNNVTLQAVTDLNAAYNQLHNKVPTNTTHAPAFGAGETLTPGVYSLGGAGSIAGTLILDSQGNPNSVFIFKMGGAFTTAAGATVTLINNAIADNIYWVAEGAIAMAASTTMHGTMVAHNGAISIGANGYLHGRMYSTTGAVSTYQSVILIVGDGFGGVVSSDQSICPGTAAANLTLAGNTREVLKWQKASDIDFTTPTDIFNTTTLLTSAAIGTLTATTYFRAVVRAGVCASVTSTPAAVSIISPNAGNLSTTTTTICKNTAPNAITLSGQIGSVVKWQYANDASFTSAVTDILSTATTLTPADMGRLSATRYYRAVVRNGSCTSTNTHAIEILVPAPVIYANGAWSAVPNETTPVIINSNLNLSSDLHVCSCQVSGTATVTVHEGVTFTVEQAITVDAAANLLVENDANLVQVDDAAIDTGKITVKRETAPMKKLDFTYWSSPVVGSTLFDLSPNTLSDKYYSYSPTIGNWVTHNNGAVCMAQGKGYIVRAPQSFSTTVATPYLDGQFNGVPNNGAIATPILVAATDMNLIGNPYPSAVDADLFLTNAANSGVVGGTIYFWTHNSAPALIPGDAMYNYASNDYAAYNVTGGIATSTMGNNEKPTGKIASGQSFFIKGIANGQAVFNNSMRIAASNDQFFRGAAMPPPPGLEKHRIWLNLSNNQGAFKQTLIGYLPGATDGFDRAYDGVAVNGNSFINFYSIANNQNYTIQGRALPFNENQAIPLGYSSTFAGTFSISLDQFEGLFEDRNIYLVDHLTNTIVDIKLAPYQFTTQAGTFNNRFELKFTASGQRMAAQTAVVNELVVSTKDHQLKIDASAAISSIEIYDLSGRLILAQDHINTLTFTTTGLSVQNQILIVKVTGNDGMITSKKTAIQ